MTDENRKRNVLSSVGLADRKLADAEGLHGLGGYGTALSAAYYCAFHYACALLLTEGLETKTHRGLVHVLGLHFVQTGRLEPETYSLLSQLFAMRQDADYNSTSVFTSAMTLEWIDRTRTFRDAARAILRSSGYLD